MSEKTLPFIQKAAPPPKQPEEKETAETVPLLGEEEAKPKLTLDETKKLIAALPEQAQADYLNYLRDLIRRDLEDKGIVFEPIEKEP